MSVSGGGGLFETSCCLKQGDKVTWYVMQILQGGSGILASHSHRYHSGVLDYSDPSVAARRASADILPMSLLLSAAILRITWYSLDPFCATHIDPGAVTLRKLLPPLAELT